VLYFIVDAPYAASQALHELETLTTTGTGSLTLSFDQTGLPSSTKTTTYDILTTALGSTTLYSSTGTPMFIPGQRYYLAVRNTNPGETNTFRLRVTFDNTATTFAANAVPVTGTSSSPSEPNNLYQFTMGPTQPGFYFQVRDVIGNVAVRLRRGALPTTEIYDFTTNFSTTNLDQAFIQTNSSLPQLGGTWFAAVQNLGPGAASYKIVIQEINAPPVITPVGDRTIIDGQTLTLTVSAQDYNHPPNNLAFSLLSPPAGASIHPTTGVFTWTPTPAQAGSVYPIRVVVTDDGAPPLSATGTFNVTVIQQPNDPPVLTVPGSQVATQEVARAISGVSVSDPDAGNGTLELSLWATNGTLTVTKAEQTIAFGPLADKSYGAPPFAVNATASSGLAVTFTLVSGPATLSGNTVTVNDFGTVTLRASQAGNANYNAALDVDQSFTVNSKGTPVLTWTNPAGITYGTALSGTQLNATADKPGSFAYTPASGTILAAGNGQTLSVTFTPDDTANYNPASASVTINVSKAGLTVAASNASRAYGDANPALGGSLTGLRGGDVITATFTTVATAASSVGSYVIVPTLEDAAGRLTNYVVTTNNGTLTVTKAALVATPDNFSRPYGQANPTLTGMLTGVKNNEIGRAHV